MASAKFHVPVMLSVVVTDTTTGQVLLDGKAKLTASKSGTVGWYCPGSITFPQPYGCERGGIPDEAKSTAGLGFWLYKTSADGEVTITDIDGNVVDTRSAIVARKQAVADAKAALKAAQDAAK